MIKVILSSSSKVISEGIRALLSSERDFAITTVYQTRDLMRHITDDNADVIVVDFIVLANAMSSGLSEIKTILIDTGCGEENIHYAFLSKSINGFIRADADTGMLIKAIRSLQSGHLWIDNRSVIKLLAHLSILEKLHDLSAREREIIYPNVETIVYKKNSTTEIAARNETSYHQSLELDNCFKPSPLKGLVSSTVTYDANNQANNSLVVNDYTVRMGPMFEETQWQNLDLKALYGQCGDYDPATTVTSVYSNYTFSKTRINGSDVLCTLQSTEYVANDPYILPHISKNFGKVNCADRTNDTSDSTIISFTNYTAADTTRWLLPLPSETWISNSVSGTKFNHTKTYYDWWGNPTKSEIYKV